MVKLTLGRSDTLYESHNIPADAPDVVTLGPFEYVGLTYEYLRTAPDGRQLGVYRDGLWWINGDPYPFSDMDVHPAEEETDMHRYSVSFFLHADDQPDEVLERVQAMIAREGLDCDPMTVEVEHLGTVNA